MATEADKQASLNERQSNEKMQYALNRQPRFVPPDQLEQLLKGRFPKGFSINDLYKKYPAGNKKNQEYPEKFDIAWAFIEDGQYGTDAIHETDILSLVKDFFEPGCKITPELKVYQDRLRLFLVQKGRILEGSKEEKEAQESFLRVALSDEKLNELCQALPIEFMGAVARIEFYKNITDPKERERLRAFTTKSLIRPYLGNFLFEKPTGELDFRRVLDLLPDEVFSEDDQITVNLAKHYIENQTMKFFIEGEQTGFDRLNQYISIETSLIKKEFLEKIQSEFIETSNFKVPAIFNPWVFDDAASNIAGSDTFVPFPNFRQKYFAHKFCQTGRKLLCADTGGTKTACAYIGMESLGRQKVTIFGPASARDTWPEQAKKHFNADANKDVFTIETRDQLDDPRVLTANYVYVSSDLLSLATFKPTSIKESMREDEKLSILMKNQALELRSSNLMTKLIDRLVTKRQTDGIILDEAQEFRHSTANCSKTVTELVSKIQANYKPGFLLDQVNLPIIALTATPIFSDLNDLDDVMAMIYPDKYSLPQQSTKDHPSFSSACDFQADIAFIKLYGEELLMRWTTEDMFGDKVPTLRLEDIKRIQIEMTPELKVLYEWMVQLDKVRNLQKCWLLRCILINPGVIKDINRSLNHEWYKSTMTMEQVGLELNKYYKAWEEWTKIKNPRIPNQPFSADWIALQGNGNKFLLECFFHDKLVFGFDSLADIYPQMKIAVPLASTPKADFIRRHLISTIQKDEHGNYNAKSKTVVIATEQVVGITRYFEDEKADLDINAFSIYEMVLSSWLPGITRDLAINVDGNLSFKARREIAKNFRESGEKYLFMILNQESMDVSIDMAPRKNASMQNIERVDVFSINPPWHWARKKQMAGRFDRFGVGIPVRFHFLESDDSIDKGLFNIVRRTYILTQIAMSGVKLDPDDADFFDKTKLAKKIIELEPNTDQEFIRNAIRILRGAGESQLTTLLSNTKDGKTNAQRWAEFYYSQGSDEFRTVGNNAGFVASILMDESVIDTLVVGAGSCLLNRKLKKSGYNGRVTNIDINYDVMDLAKQNHPDIGELKQSSASTLPFADGSFDAVDYSMIFDMTQLLQDWRTGSLSPVEQIERVKILTEMNRVLRVGGKAVITLSEHTMDDECFIKFAQSMSSFGFNVKIGLSGKSYAVDTKPKKRLGWVLTLEKMGQPNLNDFDPNNLFLLSDDRFSISRYKGEKEVKEGIRVIDNPLYSANTFEVVNPLTNLTVTKGAINGTSSSDNLQTDQPTIPTNNLINIAPITNIDTQASQEPLHNNGSEVAAIPDYSLWEEMRADLQIGLNRKDPETLMSTIDQIKQGLEPELWRWWRGTLRDVENAIKNSHKRIDTLGLTPYEYGQIVTAIIFMGQRLYTYDSNNLFAKRIFLRVTQEIKRLIN